VESALKINYKGPLRRTDMWTAVWMSVVGCIEFLKLQLGDMLRRKTGMWMVWEDSSRLYYHVKKLFWRREDWALKMFEIYHLIWQKNINVLLRSIKGKGWLGKWFYAFKLSVKLPQVTSIAATKDFNKDKTLIFYLLGTYIEKFGFTP
jgi:hypothetical protein